MAGIIKRKPRVSLEKQPTKEYQLNWMVDMEMDGSD